MCSLKLADTGEDAPLQMSGERMGEQQLPDFRISGPGCSRRRAAARSRSAARSSRRGRTFSDPVLGEVLAKRGGPQNAGYSGDEKNAIS